MHHTAQNIHAPSLRYSSIASTSVFYKQVSILSYSIGQYSLLYAEILSLLYYIHTHLISSKYPLKTHARTALNVWSTIDTPSACLPA